MTQPPEPAEFPDAESSEPDTSSQSTRGGNSRTPLFEAQNAPRYQRQAIIKQIQEDTGRRLICYVSGNDVDIDHEDVMPVVDLLHNVPANEDLDFLLHTSGGDLDVAEKLISLIRRKVGPATLRIVVPDFAKSAGTLMVLDADWVVMSDPSELGPIDPQIRFVEANGIVRQQAAQHYLDAYDEHSKLLAINSKNIAAQIMLGKLDPTTVEACRAAKERVRQSAEKLLKSGMFRVEGGNFTKTTAELLDTKRWLSHSKGIPWDDAQDPQIGLHVEYLAPQSEQWQGYWHLYCLQKLAVGVRRKLFESDYVSQMTPSPK